MTARIYRLPSNVDWLRLRPELTSGITGCSLLPDGWRAEKIVVSRVAPGGSFFRHRDAYHHVFWFLAGEGEGFLAGESYPIRPGQVVEVPAGTEHGYCNSGGEDLLLLTINARDANGGTSEG